MSSQVTQVGVLAPLGLAPVLPLAGVAGQQATLALVAALAVAGLVGVALRQLGALAAAADTAQARADAGCPGQAVLAAGVHRQSDPDAAGHVRPRAPGAVCGRA